MQIHINNSKYFIIFEALLFFFLARKSTLGHMQCITVCRKTTVESIDIQFTGFIKCFGFEKQYKQSNRNHESVTKGRVQYLNPIFRTVIIQDKLSGFEIFGLFVDLPLLLITQGDVFTPANTSRINLLRYIMS